MEAEDATVNSFQGDEIVLELPFRLMDDCQRQVAGLRTREQKRDAVHEAATALLPAITALAAVPDPGPLRGGRLRGARRGGPGSWWAFR